MLGIVILVALQLFCRAPADPRTGPPLPETPPNVEPLPHPFQPGDDLQQPFAEAQQLRRLPPAEAIPESPREVPATANFGYVPEPAEAGEFVASLENPTLRQAAPELFLARGPPARDEENAKATLLYRYVLEVDPTWRVKAQGIGDCVSWGWAHGVDHLNAIDAIQKRQPETWMPAATEPIYGGSRVEARGKAGDGERPVGGWSDGSYGASAARWVRDYGVLWRKNYETLGVDLSRYSSSRAKEWGAYGAGGKGDGGRLDEAAKSHPVRTVALVTTFEEAAKAIENGYPVAVCSGQGFSSTRDKDGFAAPRGSWAHCMVFIGVRWDREGLLCLNSWGPNWIGGEKWPQDQPDGSFWVDRRTADRMLGGWKDSYAMSGLVGFPRRKLRHGEGW